MINNIIKLGRDEIIYGGHIQSLAASSLVFISGIFLDIKITWDILVSSYLIVYIPYLYNRFKEIDFDYLTNRSRTLHIKKYIKLVPLFFCFSVLILLIILLYFGNLNSIIFSFSIIILGFLYTIIFKIITKNIFFLKDIYVSLFFGLIIIFPLVYYKYSLDNDLLKIILILFLTVFLKSFLIQVFLDIKDLESDQKRQLKTLPVIIGENKTIKFLIISNVIITVLIPIIFILFNDILPESFLLLVFVLPFNFYCYNLLKDKKEYVYIIQSGEFILWLIIILVGNTILC